MTLRKIRKTFVSTLAVATLAATTVHLPAKAAGGSFSSIAALTQPACAITPANRAELRGLHDDIARAPTVGKAQALALAPTDAALDALGKARTLVPFSADLQEAEARLEAKRARIIAADTPPRVADEFSGMMVAGLDDDRLVHAKVGSGGCSYSTGETIAIVIGLILGIIPGLILLVVLC